MLPTLPPELIDAMGDGSGLSLVLRLRRGEDEAMRDLIRARFQVGKAQHRARQQLKMFLLRHNLRALDLCVGRAEFNDKVGERR